MAQTTSKRTTRKPARPRRREPAAPARRRGDRVEAYRRLATQIASDVGATGPSTLLGQARREHVRATVREDHGARIQERAAGAEEKFDKLTGSLFAFFRGVGLLFYRDMVGSDAAMPTVLALGDVHPGNFGVMPNADNVPIFGVNDFDDAAYAPFTWDLKRGSVGFMLAADEFGGHGAKTQRRIAGKFLRGYLDAMRRYADGAAERDDAFRIDNSPKLIRKLIEAADRNRADWLKDDYHDESGRGFRSSEDLEPVSSRAAEFEETLKAMFAARGAKPPARAGDLKVKDVAKRHGQGTASLGLPRYYVLVEGPAQDGTDDLIVEFKRARLSALEGLTPDNPFDAGDEADRIAHGQSVQIANGDVFYGAVEVEGESFITRERAPFRADIDLEGLSKKKWLKYARICGRALAQAHARSDDVGRVDYDVDPRILKAAQPEDLFVDDVIDFAEDALVRLRRDHAFFKRDHRLCAFTQVETVYR